MSHEHRLNIVKEEVLRHPPVAGTSRRRFTVAICGGREGCGAIKFGDYWYENAEMRALYESSRSAGA